FTLLRLHPLATEGQRRFQLRLVGGRNDATCLGRLVGRGLIAGAHGEGEDPLPGGGEILLLTEPRLAGSDLEREDRVLRIGGGRLRQIGDGLARAAGTLVSRGEFGEQGAVASLAVNHFAIFGDGPLPILSGRVQIADAGSRWRV